VVNAASAALRGGALPAETPAESPSTNGADDDRPLAEKLHHALWCVESLCSDKNNWPPLSAAKQRELRGAMKKLFELRELLPKLATPKERQP
jgi:hypothetical protein